MTIGRCIIHKIMIIVKIYNAFNGNNITNFMRHLSDSKEISVRNKKDQMQNQGNRNIVPHQCASGRKFAIISRIILHF